MDELEGDLAGAEENVVIRAGNCSVTLVPAMGGKIASIRVGNNELLQTPLKPFASRTRTMAFSDSDASGWDECLPSVAECTVETEAGSAAIPDHGDLWRVPWQVLDTSQAPETQDSATLRAQCFSLPLELTRSMILTESPSGWSLQLLYSLTNLGIYRVPWAWSAHPLFAVDAGDRVVLQSEVASLRLEGSAAGRLGVHGDSISWPLAKSHDSSGNPSEVDLSLVPGLDSSGPDSSGPDSSVPDSSGADSPGADSPSSDLKIGDKLFAGPFGLEQAAWCAIERLRLGLRMTVRFDPSLTPYLGLWLCYGGWPDNPGIPGATQFCVAPEPATAPIDSLAKTGSWSRWLDPGETLNWPMELLIDRMTPETTANNLI